MKNNHSLKILITSPSFNSENNVAGISSFTQLLIENNHLVKYILFVRGKKNSDRRGFYWLVKQPVVLLNFIILMVKERSITIAHINMPLVNIGIIRDSFLIIIASCFRKKVVLHFHGGKYNLNNNIPFHLKIMLRISISLSKKIITQGNKEKEYFIDYLNTKSEKIIILPNSVKILSSLPDKLRDEPVILFLSRIDKNKGLKEILLALEQLNNKIDYQFLIAGDGPDKKYFLDECKKRIPNNYEYLGIVNGEKKESVLKKANIFLMPSYYEGLPYSLLEAMAYKLVPIVTPVGSIPEIIEDGKNGFLVPVHDYKAITISIIELIEKPTEFEEISQNAYNTIKSRYSLSGYITKINTLYSNLWPKF